MLQHSAVWQRKSQYQQKEADTISMPTSDLMISRAVKKVMMHILNTQ